MTGAKTHDSPSKMFPTQARWVKAETSELIKRGLRLAVEVEATLAAEQQLADCLEGEPPAAELETPSQGLQVPDPRLSCRLRPATVSGTWGNASSRTSDHAWAEVWVQRGRNKFRQQDYAGALTNFQQALVKQSALAEAYNGMGSCFYMQGQFAEAANAHRQALKLSPKQSQIYCNLGAALYQMGDLTGAVDAYEQAVQLCPRLIAAHYGLGVALYKQGQYDRATLAYQNALDIQPTHADSYYGLGAALYRLGQQTAAIAAYARAAQFSAKYVQSYLTWKAQLPLEDLADL
ncbi:tetratricopeptide repeat protein [Synechococcales cyanobacterium C]|uniref:Tetratricopeptide repeat protein n=1 Tax=Petrachloros mirabilis ULC683 TaxID=2781853 RepID=A0A8K1ZY36_9CYAN|nr:tetratricopeptide repeat protein [Petrachloros mirabilis]NCJ05767.1 tetratricopeptide repeat protein [Petrachloros mirabilis ULC683]